MNLKLLIFPTLLTTSLFAQGPNGFNNRPPNPDGTPGNPAPNDMQRPPGGGRPGRGWERRRGRMAMRGRERGPQEVDVARLLNDPGIRAQLGVTADQFAKIRLQETEFRKAEIRNRADLEIKRLDLNELLSADKPDRAAIDGKLQEVGTAQIALEKSAIDYRLNMREALTPAQRQRLQQLMAQPRRALTVNSGPVVRGPQGVVRGRGPAPQPPPNGPAQARPTQ